ncbi:MAG: hypothetical protein ABSA30_00520 [Candidatus Aminicenantales bacterium]
MSSRNKLTYEILPTINRNAIWIEPTAVFLEWAQKFPDIDTELTLDELLKDGTAYLIPEQEDEPDAWLKRNFKTIFEVELDGWCTDSFLWPKDRSFKAFKKFFVIHFCSVVIDLGKSSIDKT